MKRVNRSVCSTLEETFQEYTGVIHYTCKRMSYLTKNSTETYDDLFQIASIAFMKAFEQFDEKKGKNFVTFSIPYMEGYIKHHFRDKGGTIKFPRYFRKVWKYAEKKDNGHFDVEQISIKTKLPIDKVNEALKYIESQKLASLDEYCNDSESEGYNIKVKNEVSSLDDESLHYVEEFMEELGEINEEYKEMVYLKLKGYNQCEISRKVGKSKVQVTRDFKKIREIWEEYAKG